MSTQLPSARNVALVGAGGAVGALARVALASWFPVATDGFPWTTFLENLAGAFLLGLVLTLLTERVTADPALRLAVCTGGLGAFTTYSTLATELGTLAADGHGLVAATYAVASLAGGLAAALVGIRLAGRWAWRRSSRVAGRTGGVR